MNKFVHFWSQLGIKNGLVKNLKLSGWISYPNSQMESCLVWKKKELPSNPYVKQKQIHGIFLMPRKRSNFLANFMFLIVSLTLIVSSVTTVLPEIMLARYIMLGKDQGMLTNVIIWKLMHLELLILLLLILYKFLILCFPRKTQKYVEKFSSMWIIVS